MMTGIVIGLLVGLVVGNRSAKSGLPNIVIDLGSKPTGTSAPARLPKSRRRR